MTDTPTRECAECTACCEGWLSGIIRGHTMKPGKQCHFLGCNRCSIYEERPEKPCRDFNCAWLKDTKQIIPEWMKPSLSKVIITERDWSGPSVGGISVKSKYWYVTECGEKIDSSVLSWLIQHCLSTETPLIYHVGGSRNIIGPPEFHMVMKDKFDFLY